MGDPYTPARRLRQAVTPALPQGDPANLAFARELLDARAYALGGLSGAYVGTDTVLVGGDATTPTLTVGDCAAVTARDSTQAWWAGGWTSLPDVQPGALAASTMHYLYVRAQTSGALAYVVSTTAPADGVFRTSGSELQTCLGAFAAGLLGFPLPLVTSRRAGRYITSSGRSELTVLAPGGTGTGIARATSFTAVDLSALVPPWATTAWVMARLHHASADAGGNELRLRRSSADGGYLVAARTLPSNGSTALYDEKLVQVPLLNRAFEYRLAAAPTDDAPYGATLTVAGWD